MSYRVRKRTDSGDTSRPYKIIRELPGGSTRQVGTSASHTKAKQSAGIAESNETKARRRR